MRQGDFMTRIDLQDAYLTEDPCSAPQPPKILVERCGLPVQSPALWPSNCPSGIFEADAGSSGIHERTRHSSDPVSI